MRAFNLRPTLSTFLGTAYPCGMVEQPLLPSPILDWNIQWAFPLQKHVDDRLHFNFQPRLNIRRYAALGLLGLRDYSPELPLILRENKLIQLVSSILNAGAYALLYADYYHLKGTAEHLKKHFRHDFLIVDFDPGPREFTGVLYGANGVLSLATVTRDCLPEAFLSPAVPRKKCAPHCRRDVLMALQAGKDPDLFGPLHRPDIKIQLRCYLDSSDLTGQALGNRLIKRFCKVDSLPLADAAFGVGVYQQVREYFGRLSADHAFRYDARITRLIWEHKKLMRRRLLRLIGEGVLIPESVQSEWVEIEELAQGMHFQAFAAKTRGDQRLLATLGAALEKIQSIESSAVGRLLEII